MSRVGGSLVPSGAFAAEKEPTRLKSAFSRVFKVLDVLRL